MTTPPKAPRFHISRSESPAAGLRPDAPAAPQVRVEVQRGAAVSRAGDANPTPPQTSPAAPDSRDLLAPLDDGFGNAAFPGSAAEERAQKAAAAASAASAKQASPAPASPPQPQPQDDEAALAAIRAENLTSRQLRMAARIAAMHEIEVASEAEAVLRLRQRGIDPFHRASVGRILSSEGNRAQSSQSANVPAQIARAKPPARAGRREIMPIPPDGALARVDPAKAPALPPREALTEERRAAEIFRIQRDIARRRRKRLSLLMIRLAFFVGLPTLIAGWYYYRQASPLYNTHSQFLIQQAEMQGGQMGGLLGGSQLATNTDSVSVQSYLSSRDAMLRLDEELGFKRAFQDPSLDPILRLSPNASNEEAYKQYKRSVKIGYDPTEGVIELDVIAPDPQLSEQFSLALIRYAEGQVDQMTSRIRDDQMQGTVESYREAERNVQQAQARVQDLQQRMGVLDPAAEGSAVMSQVSQLEGELNKKRLELGQLQANPRPNQSRVQGVQGDITRLEGMIADTRSKLTEDTGRRASLASITGEIRIAEGDLEVRQQLLATAAQQMEAARIEANKQVRYLSLSVAPIPPDEPTYPKAFQNTLVAFLIFAGIYLMLSLTVSILREQVSS